MGIDRELAACAAIAASAIAACALPGCNAIFGLAPTQLGREDGGGDDTLPVDSGPGLDAAPRDHQGLIQADSDGYFDATANLPVLGFGVQASIAHESPVCARTLIDAACTLTTCIAITERGPWPSAGVLSLLSESTATLTPAIDGSYDAVASSSSRLFEDGALVEVDGSGADIPAFVEKVIAPTSVTFGQTLPTEATQLQVQRSNGLALSWIGGVAGSVVTVQIVGSDQSVLTCRFDATDGEGLMSAAALTRLPAGNASFTAVVARSTVFVSGDYALEILLQVVGKVAGGDWASGAMSLD